MLVPYLIDPMQAFRSLLRRYNTASPAQRQWVYVPYDQLSDRMGPIATIPPEKLGIVLIESTWKGRRRPYHKQKLAYILANSRHFAIEQAKRQVAVKYIHTDQRFSQVLQQVIEEVGCVSMMRPAERELRADLAGLVKSGQLKVLPHEGWLTSQHDLLSQVSPHPPWRMDRFYQKLRQKTGILMENGKPLGGKYSYDAENRKPWKGTPEAPAVPTFPVDSIKREVQQLIENQFFEHPGEFNIHELPATQKDAQRLWEWAKKHCMTFFGPYEDAMSHRSRSLFHTRISALLNIGRLTAKQLVTDVLKLDIPLPSKEGFIRQVLGWREFMYQIHEATDGFRRISTRAGVQREKSAESPGCARYQQWNPKWKKIQETSDESSLLDGGSQINRLGYHNDLPPAFWSARSGLYCLDHVVQQVMQEGYTHHIPRLMVLANIATLLEIDPRQITDWFWCAFVDAYDWVVEPNVLAMGTFATGEVLSTKPYIAGSGYINKMSDFCKQCAFDPKKTCPVTRWYWAFLARHQEQFANNFRMRMILSSLRKRSPQKKQQDQEYFTRAMRLLSEGRPLQPQDFYELVNS